MNHLFSLFLMFMTFLSGGQVTIHLVGDSTMADKPHPETNPERGWGQMLHEFFSESVTILNHAVNGRSTRSFLSEGKWEAVRSTLSPGDYVFIQFGHNDEKNHDSSRYTNPWTGFRRNLARFVLDAREKGAIPVLFTPVVRRNFNDDGVLEDTHGAYPFVMRDVARELNVPLIDLQLKTEDLVRSLGPEPSKDLYMWITPGAYAMYPEGKQDNTHFTAAGARAVARLAAEGVRDSRLPLATMVKLPEK